MYRGASYADAMRYHRCIDLWRRALEIRVEKDTILYSDTCFTAQALVRLMIDLKEKTLVGNTLEDENQIFQDVVATFHLLTDNITGIVIIIIYFLLNIIQCIMYKSLLSNINDKQMLH